MKYFTIIKTGYRAGVYGCIAEYFNCIFSNDEGMNNFRFHGLYGAEERVSAEMKKRGYKQYYCPSVYGKCVQADTKGSYEEHTAIKNIDELIKHGYLESK